MLIEFKVANYRSIGEEQVLSLVPASNQNEYPDNIIQKSSYAALNGIVLYGANGSGKSNLLRAIVAMSNIIRISAMSSSTSLLPYDPFLLREGYAQKNTTFEMTFVIGESRYRYFRLQCLCRGNSTQDCKGSCKYQAASEIRC